MGRAAAVIAVSGALAVAAMPGAAHAAVTEIEPNLPFADPVPQLGPTEYWNSPSLTDTGGAPEAPTRNWSGITASHAFPVGVTNVVFEPADLSESLPGYRTAAAWDGPIPATVTRVATEDDNAYYDETRGTGLNKNENFNPSEGTYIVNDGVWETFRYGGTPIASANQLTTITYDFSQLPDGVLPAGTLLRTSDADTCVGGLPGEQVSFSSNVTSPWLEYEFTWQIPGRGMVGTPPTTTFNDVTGVYEQSSNCDGDINMGSYFLTTENLTNLTIQLRNAAGGAWVYAGFHLPTEQIPGSLIWTKTNEAGELLPGAGFAVQGADGASLNVLDNGEFDSDKTDGAFRVDNLPWGTYTVTESQAPAGYELSTEATTAEISIEALEVDLGTLVNVALPEPTPEPTTEPTPEPTTEPAPTTDPTTQPAPEPTTEPSAPATVSPSSPAAPGAVANTGGVAGDDGGSAQWLGWAMLGAGAIGGSLLLARRRTTDTDS